MAEWLRPGLWEILMLSRGIEPGQVLTSKKSTQYVDGRVNSRLRFYVAGIDQIYQWLQASFFCEIAMVTRGFETRLQILPSKEVNIVRRDGFNHVRDSIWRRHQPIF